MKVNRHIQTRLGRRPGRRPTDATSSIRFKLQGRRRRRHGPHCGPLLSIAGGVHGRSAQ